MRHEDSWTRTLVGVWEEKALLVVIGRCNEAWPLSEIRTAFSCLDFYYSADELCSARLPKSDFHFIMVLYLKERKKSFSSVTSRFCTILMPPLFLSYSVTVRVTKKTR